MPPRDDGYVYANGRIRALEETFIGSRMWQMMLSAHDLDELVRLLSDTWYGDFLADSEHRVGDAVLSALEATERELVDLAEDEQLVSGLLHRRDVRNARYLWKSELIREESSEPPVERPGLLAVSILREAVSDPDAREGLPAHFRIALESLLAIAAPGVREIEKVMDSLAAEVERMELPRFGTALDAYVRTRIELSNFRTAARCRISGMARAEVEKMLQAGGAHSAEEIGEACSAGTLADLLSETDGASGAARALREVLEGASFLPYERESERLLLELLEDASTYRVFGPEPLGAMILRRELEGRHLSLLAAGKAAGMDRERIMQRIPRG